MLRARDRELPLGRPALMGIVNVNPDSFSDPGPRTVDGVLATAARLVGEGAAVLDLGAQSAITGRLPLDPGAEAAALVGVVREVVAAFPSVVVSVDTFKAPVVEAVLEAGAHLVNDVSGLADVGVARLCARYGAALVVMHTAVPPLTRRQDVGLYDQVAGEVAAFLADRVAAALDAGVAPESVLVDPGVDFAKTPGQSVDLLRGIGEVVALGYPLLLALSRKDFVGALTGQPPSGRGPGTLGAVAALRHVSRQVLRVHDVAATRDLLAVLDAIRSAAPAAPADPALTLPDHLRHEPRP